MSSRIRRKTKTYKSLAVPYPNSMKPALRNIANPPYIRLLAFSHSRKTMPLGSPKQRGYVAAPIPKRVNEAKMKKPMERVESSARTKEVTVGPEKERVKNSICTSHILICIATVIIV